MDATIPALCCAVHKSQIGESIRSRPGGCLRAGWCVAGCRPFWAGVVWAWTDSRFKTMIMRRCFARKYLALPDYL